MLISNPQAPTTSSLTSSPTLAPPILREENNSKSNNIPLPRIIGIEGSWGSGKSNLIKILKQEYLNNDHYFFEYDAWGHQEDLQRRSFLENLTESLINEEILKGETTVTSNKGIEKKTNWRDRLNYLLARKYETEIEKFPRIGYGIIIAFFTLITFPITSYITYKYELNIFIEIIPILSPLLISLIVWKWKARQNDKYKGLDFFFAVYQDKVHKNIEYKTISQKEPSVTEFKKWMSDISLSIIKNNSKKLIIVFDNMDRLPAIKVKELWSSIHTFFAEKSYENIWTIIPFDQNHLSNAFGKEESTENHEAKILTSHFISKTFPIVYRVATPIITDLKQVFNSYFNEAFGNKLINNQEKETILRVYTISKPESTVREIISFINELVQYYHYWNTDIPLLHISIFAISKSKIINNKESIAENILSDIHLMNIDTLISDKNSVRESISALAYNIDRKTAKQIPMRQYLKSLFNDDKTKEDINLYSENSLFVDVLDDVIEEIDISKIDHLILTVGKVDKKITSNNIDKFLLIWNSLIAKKMKQSLVQLEFSEVHQLMLTNGSLETNEAAIGYLCDQYNNFKEIDGTTYFNTISSFEKYLIDNKSINLSPHIKDIALSPEEFLKFVKSAKNNFVRHKVKTDNKSLNKYLIGLLPGEMIYTEVFKYLKNNNYNFNEFHEELRKNIPNINDKNFYYLNYVDKVLTKEKPFDKIITTDQVTTIQSAINDKSKKGYYDLSAIAIANNMPTNIDVDDDEQITEVSKVIEYYQNYGQLLENMLNWNNPILNKVMADLTSNSYERSTAIITDLIPKIDKYISFMLIEPNILLDRFNGWTKYLNKELNGENLETIVPLVFYNYSIAHSNELTKCVHKVATDKLKDIPKDTLFDNRTNPDYYWISVPSSLIEGKILKTLPDNYIEFVNNVLSDIPTTDTSPVEPVLNILNIVPQSRITATIKDICDKFYSENPKITSAMFSFFEKYFRTKDRLESKEPVFTRKILTNIINDQNSLGLILDNSEFYSNIVKKAGDDAENFKTSIKNICAKHPSVSLKFFMTSIGISVEKKKE